MKAPWTGFKITKGKGHGYLMEELGNGSEDAIYQRFTLNELKLLRSALAKFFSKERL